MKKLNGAKVLVTGGARGIGLELALGFARAGAEPIITDIDEAALLEGKKRIETEGVKCHTCIMDVTDNDSILAAREKIHKEIGKVNILVNNAGVVFGGPFLDVPLERHFLTYKINIQGMVAVTHAFLDDVIKSPEGHLVYLASASGFVGLPKGSTYASSKWATIGFSESIRLEMKEFGHNHVGVTTVCPSYVGTGMFDGAKPVKLTKLIDPAKLADKVVSAVKKNSAFVLEPWIVKITPAIKGALPTQMSDLISGVFGATSSMKDWKGH